MFRPLFVNLPFDLDKKIQQNKYELEVKGRQMCFFWENMSNLLRLEVLYFANIHCVSLDKHKFLKIACDKAKNKVVRRRATQALKLP